MTALQNEPKEIKNLFLNNYSQRPRGHVVEEMKNANDTLAQILSAKLEHLR